MISRYLVSTDDKKIASVCKKLGADVPFLRPKKLSTDKARAVDADAHALEFCEREEGKNMIFL